MSTTRSIMIPRGSPANFLNHPAIPQQHRVTNSGTQETLVSVPVARGGPRARASHPLKAEDSCAFCDEPLGETAEWALLLAPCAHATHLLCFAAAVKEANFTPKPAACACKAPVTHVTATPGSAAFDLLPAIHDTLRAPLRRAAANGTTGTATTKARKTTLAQVPGARPGLIALLLPLLAVSAPVALPSLVLFLSPVLVRRLLELLDRPLDEELFKEAGLPDQELLDWPLDEELFKEAGSPSQELLDLSLDEELFKEAGLPDQELLDWPLDEERFNETGSPAQSLSLTPFGRFS
ncbi:hypothetical protein EDC01DRAFT_774645 [Geopyxis carbonaria]|nr:hypothetical protein EDC01DRAFT_774645 [Geopyxis carbonaria]